MSSPNHVLVAFGTRPEAIKMAPVILALRRRSSFRVSVCVTAQHREMLDQVLDLFDIVPDVDLDLMKDDQDLFEVTSSVLLHMRDVLEEAAPDMVLVQGDTTSTMASGLAAFYQQIPVAHLEAGLRTYDIYSPWPEEINRQFASTIAALHFAPTDWARQNLISENVDTSQITVTGNTVIDALQLIQNRIQDNDKLRADLHNTFPFLSSDRRLLLVTSHRRENFGEGLANICRALQRLSERDDVDIVYPVHLNPSVKGPVYDRLGDEAHIHLLPPQGYVQFVYLMSKSYLVMTDSGGIQEEAPGLGKPVLVMRDSTERPEAIEAGTARLVGTDQDTLVEAASELLDCPSAYANMANRENPYGNGKASSFVAQAIEDYFKVKE